MKVVYPICCGVDVHKTFLVGTIISTTNGVQPHYQKKRFSTYNSDLHRFADWLHTNNCIDVCMESTGKYWVPVFNILEERSIRVTIANPKWVKAVKGNKDDTKDSKWIGDLFRWACQKFCVNASANFPIFFHDLWSLYMVHKVKVATAFILTFTLCTIYI